MSKIFKSNLIDCNEFEKSIKREFIEAYPEATVEEFFFALEGLRRQINLMQEQIKKVGKINYMILPFDGFLK